MFDSYEDLICGKCGAEFKGRKPAEGGVIACGPCQCLDELPMVKEGDEIPVTVGNEILGGAGENGDSRAED